MLVELAVVMGKETRDCPASEAMDSVAGMSIYLFMKYGRIWLLKVDLYRLCFSH